MENQQLYECIKCNVSKNLRKMCKRKDKKNQIIIRPLCQSCKYESSNKEFNKKRLDNFYKNNPTKNQKEYNRRYYEKNKEKLKAKRILNKEFYNKRAREYYYKRRFLNGFKIPEDFVFEHITAPLIA